MKKNFIKNRYVIVFFLVLIISFFFNNFCFPVAMDEIWNYGFSYNISKGMVIYRDFNCMQTPLYFFICSIAINILGNYLFVLNIVNAILIAAIMAMVFKIIGWKSIIVYPFIIFFCPPSYNLLCLFWLFLIIYLLYNKKDDNTILGLIISFLFLTKQTVGCCLFIPYFFYSKNKLKSMIIFSIPVVILLIYLIYNNALYNFIDYCFLGLFDFVSRNSDISILLVFEIINVIFLFIILVRNRFKNKELFYILMFQIIAFPLSDIYHFLLSFVPIVYYFVKEIKNLYFLVCFFIIVYYTFSLLIYYNYNFDISFNNTNFLYLRNSSSFAGFDFYDKIDIYKEYNSNNKFIISSNTYLLKLYMNEPIIKFDFLLNGNMGYNGANKFINEIDNICSIDSCIFFVDGDVSNNSGQFSVEIYNHIINNYKKIEENKYFYIYSN